MIKYLSFTLYPFIVFFSQFIYSNEVKILNHNEKNSAHLESTLEEKLFQINDIKTSEFKFDIKKYVGIWYEQARLPTSFQKNCNSSEAQYTLNNDATIKVLNTCIRIDGSINDIIGKAKVDPNDPRGRSLIVSFNFITDIINFFRGVNYSIYYIDNYYNYAIVGTPQKDMLWILTREKKIHSKILEKLLYLAKESGFDTSTVIFDKR